MSVPCRCLAVALASLALARLSAQTLDINGTTVTISSGGNSYTDLRVYGNGTLIQNGGVLDITALSAKIGRYSQGTFQMNGGTFQSTGLVIGYGRQGYLYQTGGVINVNNTLRVAYTENFDHGSGLVDLAGGQLTSTDVLFDGGSNSEFSHVYVHGGTISTSAFTRYVGTAITPMLSLEGGRVRATASNANFVSTGILVQALGTATTIDTNGFTIGIQSAIQHGGAPAIDGGIIVTGGGTLTLNSINTHTGQTQLQGATTLLLTGTNSLQSSTLNITSGTVQFLSQTTGTLGGLAGSQNLALVNNTAGALTLSVGRNNQSSEYSGVLSGAGALVKNGTGALTLSGLNTYTGGTVINSGTLILQSNPNTGVGNIRGALTVNNAVVVANASNALGYNDNAKVDTFTINSGTFISAASNDQGWGVAYTLNNSLLSSNNGVSSGTTLAKFAFGNNTSVTVNSGSSTIAGRVDLRGDFNLNSNFTVNSGAALLVSAAITSSFGNTGFTKLGAGVMILTGSNTYTGGTQINAGTLLVNNSDGSGTGTGAVVVSGGLLGGSGIISGTVRVQNSGTLAAGNSIGTLTVGTLAMEDAAAFAAEINTATELSDMVAANGNLLLDLDNSVVLRLTDLGGNQLMDLGTTFTIIDYSGTWNGGTFAGLADDSFFEYGVNTYQISYNGADNATSAVTLTAVPEPASTALLFGAASMLALCKRKRS